MGLHITVETSIFANFKSVIVLKWLTIIEHICRIWLNRHTCKYISISLYIYRYGI